MILASIFLGDIRGEVMDGEQRQGRGSRGEQRVWNGHRGQGERELAKKRSSLSEQYWVVT